MGYMFHDAIIVTACDLGAAHARAVEIFATFDDSPSTFKGETLVSDLTPAAWTGVLEAERYGVPQTRERAFLLAHRDHQPEPPVPTHQRYVSGEPARYEPASMFHAEILPWVSAAEACGWGRCDGTMEHQRGAGMAERHGDRDPRPIHAPAPTMTAGAGRRIKVDRWIDTRRDQRPDGNAIRLNIAEGLVLQSFPHDFALAGNKTSQWRQVGNAVPPLLSKVTLAALLRVVLTPEQWATYHRETL